MRPLLLQMRLHFMHQNGCLNEGGSCAALCVSRVLPTAATFRSRAKIVQKYDHQVSVFVDAGATT